MPKSYTCTEKLPTCKYTVQCTNVRIHANYYAEVVWKKLLFEEYMYCVVFLKLSPWCVVGLCVYVCVCVYILWNLVPTHVLVSVCVCSRGYVLYLYICTCTCLWAPFLYVLYYSPLLPGSSRYMYGRSSERVRFTKTGERGMWVCL